MNSIIKNIKERRSCRDFTKDEIPRELLDLVCEAAIWAPSGTNRQPWYFTVVRNARIISELNLATKECISSHENPYFSRMGQNPNLDLFYGAPVVIVVSCNGEAVTPVMDISAATQNILLAAESLNLGTCWNGLVTYLFKREPDHPVISRLQIPEGYTPSHAIAIGFKAREGKAPRRKGIFTSYVD